MKQKMSLLYKNKYKSQTLTLNLKNSERPCGVFENFLIFHSNQTNSQEMEQLDCFSLFENLIMQKDYSLVREFVLRFLKGSKNTESKN